MPSETNPGATNSGETNAAENAASKTTDAQLTQLVVDCLAQMETRGDTALEEFCSQHPDQADSLRRRIQLLQEAGLFEKPATATPDDHDIPERLGEFRLLRRLGAGGMGVVYLAEQESVGRHVALKLIRPELLYFDRARSRFQREVESAGRLAHPGIVSIHAVGEEGGIPYFAMEYVHGCSLADILTAVRGRSVRELTGRDMARVVAGYSNGDQDTAETALVEASFGGSWVETCFRLIRQAAEAVDHAHQHGVLHRDLKPSNIMVTPEGRVVILDFGLASIEGGGKLTQSGSRLGSLDYMSPEQIRGDNGAVDRRTDIYALGVTLYELLTLRSPYVAKTEELVRIRILEGRARSIRTANSNVAWDAETVCLTAMEPDAVRRYQSAGEFGRDLHNYLALRPIEARRPGTWLRLRRWAQRNPARAVAAALAVLLTLGGPLGYAWQQHNAAIEIGQERDSAELSLKFAFDALEKMGTEMAQTRLRHVPQAEQLRRQVLQNTLEFYQAFLARRGDEPRLRKQTARATARVAMIHFHLGDFKESQNAAEQGVQLYDSLVADDPDNLKERHNRAELHQLLASLHGAVGRSKLAEKILGQVARDFRMLTAKNPDDINAKNLLAQVCFNRSILLNRLNQPEERNKSIHEALQLREDLVRLRPGQAKYRYRLATSYVAQIHFLSRKKPDAAEQLCTKTLALYTDLLEEDATNADYRVGLASLYTQRGILRGNQTTNRKRFERAYKDHRAACRIREQLVRDFPTVPRYHSDLGASLSNVAGQFNNTRQFKRAKPLLERAIRHQKKALSMVPDHVTYRRYLINHRAKLGGALIGMKLHREAAKLVGDLSALELRPGVGSWRAAGLLAQCIRICEQDSSLSDAQRTELSQTYARDAIRYLRQASDRGLREANLMAHRHMDAIRQRPEFKKIRAEVSARVRQSGQGR